MLRMTTLLFATVTPCSIVILITNSLCLSLCCHRVVSSISMMTRCAQITTVSWLSIVTFITRNMLLMFCWVLNCQRYAEPLLLGLVGDISITMVVSSTPHTSG